MGLDRDRFVKAQSDSMLLILMEIRRKKKTGHWMWYVFPQLKSLGKSEMSEYYGLNGLEDAKEYWTDVLLGARLRDCFKIVLEMKSREEVMECFGPIDAEKLHSCASLFSLVGAMEAQCVLSKFFDGEIDESTVKLIAKECK